MDRSFQLLRTTPHSGGSALAKVCPMIRCCLTFAILLATSASHLLGASSWTGTDLGPVAITGSETTAADGVTMTAAGTDIWGTSDQGRFLHRSMTGDGEIFVRVEDLEYVNGWAKAGVMIRGSLDANSAHAFVARTGTNGVAFQRRRTAGGSSTHLSGGRSVGPVWVRLRRTGDVFEAARSADGSWWEVIGSDTIVMPETVFVGLALTSHDRARAATARFAHIGLTSSTAPLVRWVQPLAGAVLPLGETLSLSAETDLPGAPVITYLRNEHPIAVGAPATAAWTPDQVGTQILVAEAIDGDGVVHRSAPLAVEVSALPSPWLTRAIGTVVPGGSAEETTAGFTLRNSGSDIWGQRDEFRFLYQRVSGDCQIITRVASLDAPHSWTKAGVMMRAHPGTGSPHVLAAVTGHSGVAHQYRQVETGTSSHVGGGRGEAPMWLKLERRGSVFTTWRSSNGWSWTQMGTVEIALGDSMLVGLALTSHDRTTFAEAAFTHTQVLPLPASPSIAWQSPSVGAAYQHGDAIPLAVDLLDPDLSGPVIFRVNGVPVATGSPTTATWTTAAQGIHHLTAEAMSSGGILHVSEPRPVWVTDMPSPWVSEPIGAVGPNGFGTITASGQAKLGNAGSDIWNRSDAFRFVHRPMSGDVRIQARIDRLQHVHPWTKVGVMVRAGTAANAPHAFIAITGTNGVAFQHRSSTNDISNHLGGGAGNEPIWLRLERRGNDLIGYRSLDAITWVEVGRATMPLDQTVRVGLALTSHDRGAYAEAALSGVMVERLATTPLPSVGFAAASQVVLENAGIISLPIVLSHAVTVPVTVTWTVHPGTTTPGSDYVQPTNLTTVIPVGQTTVALPLEILHDAEIEGDEAFAVTLTASEGATLAGITTTTVTIQDVLINEAPTLARAASATPNPVTGTMTALSVLGADDGGEAALLYTWSVDGPAAVGIAPNATNAAKDAAATFTAPGAYTMHVVVTDAYGATVTDTVTVTVQATPTTMDVSPSVATVVAGATQAFQVGLADQFLQPIQPLPDVDWSVDGGGSISATGLFTAGTTMADLGTSTVTAQAAGLNATARVTVISPINTAPTIESGPSADPAPVTGTTALMTVLGADDQGEAALTYTWSATGPAAVQFTTNGSNLAKTSTATFTTAGSYVFTVVIADADGASVAGDITVEVVATPAAIAIAPALANVVRNGTQAFAATVTDQFGTEILEPSVSWTVDALGSITEQGAFTAEMALGLATVTATSGVVTGQAAVTVINSAPTVIEPIAVNPFPIREAMATFTVLAADDAGEEHVQYGWSATGPALVTFAPTGTNAAKQALATFTASGDYIIVATLTDADGESVETNLPVTVVAIPSALTVTPATVTIPSGGTTVVTAELRDQFGSAMPMPAELAWSSTGPGTLTPQGTSAQVTGDIAGGVVTVTATVGFYTAQAVVTVDSPGDDGGDNNNDPDAPPVVPVVTLAITSGLTGDKEGDLEGDYVHFTNRDAVSVRVDAQGGEGFITSVRVYADDQYVTDLNAPGFGLVPIDIEGKVRLRAEVKIERGGHEAVAVSPVVTVFRDINPPEVALWMPDRYLGGNQVSQELASLIYLNGMDDETNSESRRRFNWNVYGRDGFDMVVKAKDEHVGLATELSRRVQVSVNSYEAESISLTADLPEAGVNAEVEGSISNFSVLSESATYDAGSGVGVIGPGHYRTQVMVADRCGNSATAPISIWVKTAKPQGGFAHIPYNGWLSGLTPFYSGEISTSPVHYFQADGDAYRMEITDRGSFSLQWGYPHTFAVKGSQQPPTIFSGNLWISPYEPLTAEVTLYDIAGNKSSMEPVEISVKIHEVAPPTEDAAALGAHTRGHWFAYEIFGFYGKYYYDPSTDVIDPYWGDARLLLVNEAGPTRFVGDSGFEPGHPNFFDQWTSIDGRADVKSETHQQTTTSPGLVLTSAPHPGDRAFYIFDEYDDTMEISFFGNRQHLASTDRAQFDSGELIVHAEWDSPILPFDFSDPDGERNWLANYKVHSGATHSKELFNVSMGLTYLSEESYFGTLQNDSTYYAEYTYKRWDVLPKQSIQGFGKAGPTVFRMTNPVVMPKPSWKKSAPNTIQKVSWLIEASEFLAKGERASVELRDSDFTESLSHQGEEEVRLVRKQGSATRDYNEDFPGWLEWSRNGGYNLNYEYRSGVFDQTDFRLTAIDSRVDGVDDSEIPTDYRWISNYPNLRPVGISPDIWATGNSYELTVTGDVLALVFSKDGVNYTMSLDEYERIQDSPEAQDSLKNKIAIIDLVTREVTMTVEEDVSEQPEEPEVITYTVIDKMTILVGSDVPAELFDLDVVILPDILDIRYHNVRSYPVDFAKTYTGSVPVGATHQYGGTGVGNYGGADVAHRMKGAVALADVHLIETRFANIDDDVREPDASLQTRSRFLHLGRVTPILFIDESATTLTDDVLRVSGRVISPAQVVTDVVDTAGGVQVEVRLGQENALVNADGYFNAEMPLTVPEQTVSVTAYDAIGWYASSTLIVTGDNVEVHSGYAWHPTVQMFDGAPAESLIGRWLLEHSPITIQARDGEGRVIDSVLVPLRIYQERVRSEPFVVSPIGPQADLSLSDFLNRVLVVPGLDHDLVVQVDGRDFATIELAGIQIEGIDERRFEAGDFAPADPEAGPPPTDATATTVRYAISARNVGQTFTLKVTDRLSETDTTATFSWAHQDPERHLQTVPEVSIPVRMGVNALRFDEIIDRDGRAVFQPHPDEVFLRNPQVPVQGAFAEVQPDKVVFYIEVDQTRVDPLADPSDRIRGFNHTLRRLGLRVVGMEEFRDQADAGTPMLVNVWLKPDGNHDPDWIVDRLKTEGFIARYYGRDQFLVPTLRQPPVADRRPLWQRRGANRVEQVRWSQALRQAERDMWDNNADLFQSEILDVPEVRSLYVVDARVTDEDPFAGGASIIDGFAIKKPFSKILQSPPEYGYAINGNPVNPTYKVRHFNLTGVKQARTANAADKRGSPLWVDAQETGNAFGLSDLIGPATQGVVITIHGYNVDSTLEAGRASAYGTLRSYYPGFQSLLYDATLANVPAYDPVTKAGYLVLNVAWLGNWEQNAIAPSSAFFNWDNALAFDAGTRVLWQLMQAVDETRREKGISREQLPMTICAESLGNRVATSLLEGLKDPLKGQFSLDPQASFPQVSFPLVRFAMLHPALRHADLTNVSQNQELVLNQLPRSPLQSEMAGLATHGQKALLVYSPFDKPGLVFNSVQNAPGPFFQPPEVQMLGRVGLSADSGYQRPTARVEIDAFFSGRGTVYEDLWHVTLCGWVLPGMQSPSRPTYEWNSTRWIGSRLLMSVAPRADNIQITTREHLRPLWQALGAYIQSGSTPEQMP